MCWDYLDGTCSPGLAASLDAHFSRCPSCAHLRDLQERFFASLGAVRGRAAPARLHDRVRRALAAEGRHYRPQ